MSGDSVWELVGGGEILFEPRPDGGFDVQHASRSYNSFGFIVHAASWQEAERAAVDWLRNYGLTRVLI